MNLKLILNKIRLKYYSRRLRKFKDTHKGQRCLIIGNGPSLNKIDLTDLKNEITIGCNRIYLNKKLAPRYYCIEDEVLLKHVFKELENWSPKNTIKFIPQVLALYAKKMQNTYFVNFRYNQYEKKGPIFSENFSKVCYWGSTVTYMMLQLAYYLGCNPIYLIGMDGVRPGESKHFYKKNCIPENPPVYKLSDVALKKARKFLESKSVEVYNATKNPVRNFFKQITYKKIFI